MTDRDEQRTGSYKTYPNNMHKMIRRFVKQHVSGDSRRIATPVVQGRCQRVLLVLYAHLCLFFGIGISTSLTVFLDDIVNDFDTSVTTLGIFFSVRALTFGVTSPLASYLTKRWGPRLVIMTGGLLTASGVLLTAMAKSVAEIGVGVVCFTGVGSSLVYIGTLISIRHHFPTHRSYALANGITVSGSSLAVSVFAPITRLLTNAYDWRGAILISSAIILNTMVFGALMKLGQVSSQSPPTHRGSSAIALIDIKSSSKSENCFSNENNMANNTYDAETKEMINGGETLPEEGEETSKCTESISSDKMSTFLHVLLLFIIFLSTASYSAVFVYLAAAGIERGLTPMQSAGLLSATGISQAVVRFGHGLLVTVGLIKPLPLYVIVQFIMTLGILILGVFQQYSLGCVAAVMFGIGTGSVRSLNLVVQRVVDKRAGSKAVGLVVLVSEVAAATGGLFAGLLRDGSGNYLISFMVACGMTFAGTLLTIVIVVLKRFAVCKVTKTESAL